MPLAPSSVTIDPKLEAEINGLLANLRGTLAHARDLSKQLTQHGVALYYYNDGVNLSQISCIPGEIRGRITISKQY